MKASARPDLAGTFLPVTTPFDAVTGDIDVVAFGANLRHWFQSPIRGVLVAGTTGEGVLLDEGERRALLEAAADVLPEGAVLIAGTGAESTRHTLRQSCEAAESGADVVLVSPPAFFKGAMTPEALARHFRAVADDCPVPVLVYQVPLRMSTLDLPTALIGELSRHPNIAGIKDSRGKLGLIGELVEHTSEDFQVLVGSGALLLPALETGAVGGIVGVGLMATDAAAEISVAYAAGRTAEAGRIQERIAPVHQRIVAEMGVPGVKAALDLMGLHGGAPRPPLAMRPEAGADEIREILASADIHSVAGV